MHAVTSIQPLSLDVLAEHAPCEYGGCRNAAKHQVTYAATDYAPQREVRVCTVHRNKIARSEERRAVRFERAQRKS